MRSHDLTKAIELNEWAMLREVYQTKAVRGEDEYQTLLRSLFVFEYRDMGETWFDVNPILLNAKELESDD